MPREVMMVAEQAWSAHQKKCEGRECVYKEVTTRCMKCIVSAKSRTSFERAISSSIKTVLYPK